MLSLAFPAPFSSVLQSSVSLSLWLTILYPLLKCHDPFGYIISCLMFLLVVVFQGGHCLIYCHFSFTLSCLLIKNGFEPVKYYLGQLAKYSALSVESTGVTFQRERVFPPGLISHLASSCSPAVFSNIHLLGYTQLFQGPALQCGLYFLLPVSCTKHRFFSTELPPHESSAVSVPMTHSGR